MASIVMTKGNDVTKEQELVTEEIIASLRDLQKTEPIRAVERALDGVSGYPVQIELAGENFKPLQIDAEEIQTEIGAIDGVVGISSEDRKSVVSGKRGNRMMQLTSAERR